MCTYVVFKDLTLSLHSLSMFLKFVFLNVIVGDFCSGKIVGN